jgi:hypothetical protein
MSWLLAHAAGDRLAHLGRALVIRSLGLSVRKLLYLVSQSALVVQKRCEAQLH